MASELRVNTLKDASGNNSIATSFVANGSAKARCHFTTVTTTAINESFNVTSLTDTGTGDTDVNLTNAFVNASIVANFNVGSGSNGDQSFTQSATTASSIHCFNYNGNNSVHDSAFCMLCGHGDLA